MAAGVLKSVSISVDVLARGTYTKRQPKSIVTIIFLCMPVCTSIIMTIGSRLRAMSVRMFMAPLKIYTRSFAGQSCGLHGCGKGH